MFSHIGLGDSVIQSPRGDEPVFLNTVWTLQAIRGAGLWVFTILLAWPVARFYHEPRMIVLFPVLGFGCVIAGFASTSLLNLARHMGVGKTLDAGSRWAGCVVRRYFDLGTLSTRLCGHSWVAD